MATNLLQKPVQKDQFESVSFVNEPYMTHHRLKLLVKSLWKHFHTLANYLDASRPDISKAIDSVLEGNEPDIYIVLDKDFPTTFAMMLLLSMMVQPILYNSWEKMGLDSLKSPNVMKIN